MHKELVLDNTRDAEHDIFMRSQLAGLARSMQNRNKLEAIPDTSAIVDVLLKHGAHVNVCTLSSHCSALICAAGLGRLPLVETLLAARGYVHARDLQGDTPLTWAAHAGDVGVVKALLVAGANVNNMNTAGGTALMAAANFNHGDVVQTLLAAGADINEANEDGNTALMLAAREDHREVAQDLLAAGADASLMNKYGQTAGSLAAFLGHKSIASGLPLLAATTKQAPAADKPPLSTPATKRAAPELQDPADGTPSSATTDAHPLQDVEVASVPHPVTPECSLAEPPTRAKQSQLNESSWQSLSPASRWAIPFADLQVGKIIGRGSFAKVRTMQAEVLLKITRGHHSSTAMQSHTSMHQIAGV